mmetsp:Transcript_27407/g.40594  ORF Transcript_27407/g.40594 Transcript_27407/m.40594 type:complete len:211 (+) Transcript_27407:40-672(+)
MTPPAFSQNNITSEDNMEPYDLRFLASVASHHQSVARNLIPPSSSNSNPINQRQPVASSQMGQLHSLFNIASRYPVNSITLGIRSSLQPGSAVLPTNMLYNTRGSNSAPGKPNSSKSYKDDRRGFILFIHVLLKSLGKINSERDLFYKAKNVVRECLSCNRAGVTGYSPLVDVIEGRLKEIDGLNIHLEKAEGYMHRYRQRKRSSPLEPA